MTNTQKVKRFYPQRTECWYPTSLQRSYSSVCTGQPTLLFLALHGSADWSTNPHVDAVSSPQSWCLHQLTRLLFASRCMELPSKDQNAYTTPCFPVLGVAALSTSRRSPETQNCVTPFHSLDHLLTVILKCVFVKPNPAPLWDTLFVLFFCFFTDLLFIICDLTARLDSFCFLTRRSGCFSDSLIDVALDTDWPEPVNVVKLLRANEPDIFLREQKTVKGQWILNLHVSARCISSLYQPKRLYVGTVCCLVGLLLSRIRQKLLEGI